MKLKERERDEEKREKIEGENANKEVRKGNKEKGEMNNGMEKD